MFLVAVVAFVCFGFFKYWYCCFIVCLLVCLFVFGLFVSWFPFVSIMCFRVSLVSYFLQLLLVAGRG